MSAAVSVSGTKTGTILDGGEHYEVINGERVELPPMGAYQSVLASFLDQVLGPFARMKGQGRVVVETLFQLDREGKLQRKPDIAFVSYKRWPKNHRVPDTKAWDVVPDLAIEVNSPSNTGDEILQKIQDYFRAGVLCVWVVYPVTEQIFVFSSPAKNVILTKADYLDGESILPGFRFPVAQLFECVFEELPESNGASPTS
jgi:Uma2 family endonuclease